MQKRMMVSIIKRRERCVIEGFLMFAATFFNLLLKVLQW